MSSRSIKVRVSFLTWTGPMTSKIYWSIPQGTAHGFASRPNLDLPEIKAAYEEAFSQTVEWFKKTLVVWNWSFQHQYPMDMHSNFIRSCLGRKTTCACLRSICADLEVDSWLAKALSSCCKYIFRDAHLQKCVEGFFVSLVRDCSVHESFLLLVPVGCKRTISFRSWDFPGIDWALN